MQKEAMVLFLVVGLYVRELMEQSRRLRNIEKPTQKERSRHRQVRRRIERAYFKALRGDYISTEVYGSMCRDFGRGNPLHARWQTGAERRAKSKRLVARALEA